MTAPPKRRWFRFSLRTMFVVMLVFAVAAFVVRAIYPRTVDDVVGRGFTYSEVRELLGEPEKITTGPLGKIEWHYSNGVDIEFRNGICFSSNFRFTRDRWLDIPAARY